jgi:Tol biopolymer transport system component
MVPGTRGALIPFFSPDGASLGFWQDGRLRRVSLSGGPVSTICETLYPEGAAWGPGGVVVFAQGGRLYQANEGGGTPELLAAPDSGKREEFRWPELSADGRTLAFTALDSTGVPQLAAMTRPGRAVVKLGITGMSPHLVSAGYLAWVQLDGTLTAAPFEARHLRVTGTPQPVTEGIRTGPARVGKLGMAHTGAFVYLAGEAISRALGFRGPDGKSQDLPMPKDLYQAARISPDGRRLAVEIRHPGVSFRGDIWIYDLQSGSLLRLTSDSLSHIPEWSPDGKSVYFVRDGIRHQTLLRRAADGSGATDSVFDVSHDIRELQIGRDGRTMILAEVVGQGQSDVTLGVLDSLTARRPLLATPSNEGGIALAPSGKWLAYVSDETGQNEVYVRETRLGSGRWPVSRSGGNLPRWSANGRDLYFMNGDSLYLSSLGDGPQPQPSMPRAMMPLGWFAATLFFDVMPDGRLLWSHYTVGRQRTIQVTLHWFEQRRPASRAAPSP